MKSKTKKLYEKYYDFLFLISNERNFLFSSSEHELNYEKFFEAYNWVTSYHMEIKRIYRNFMKRRSEIIKKFEHQKFMIMLRPKFYYDVRKVIVSFLL